tara:strand:- start:472 stop:753 length:282 start_codon:yes stop_codon:yes gene_type:complete
MKKKPHSAEFKFKVALAAIQGDKTTAQLCSEYGIVSSQLFKWRKALLEGGSVVFREKVKDSSAPDKQIESLHATIGRLKVENDFLERVLGRST